MAAWCPHAVGWVSFFFDCRNFPSPPPPSPSFPQGLHPPRLETAHFSAVSAARTHLRPRRVASTRPRAPSRSSTRERRPLSKISTFISNKLSVYAPVCGGSLALVRDSPKSRVTRARAESPRSVYRPRIRLSPLRRIVHAERRDE